MVGLTLPSPCLYARHLMISVNKKTIIVTTHITNSANMGREHFKEHYKTDDIF